MRCTHINKPIIIIEVWIIFLECLIITVQVNSNVVLVHTLDTVCGFLVLIKGASSCDKEGEVDPALESLGEGACIYERR